LDDFTLSAKSGLRPREPSARIRRSLGPALAADPRVSLRALTVSSLVDRERQPRCMAVIADSPRTANNARKQQRLWR